MNQQTILKNLELADKIVDEACNSGYTLQDSDVRILKSIFGIIKEEVIHHTDWCAEDSADIPICKELKENGVTSDQIKAFWGAVKKAHDEEDK